MALRSPHPHAKILNLDTSDAERLPGVAVVLSRNNTPNAPFGINHKDEAAFCREKVRYVGDEVAAVAAVDEEAAREALSLIRVEYEVLPTVADPFVAQAPDALLVHDSVAGNIANEFHIKRGEIDEAFHTADATFSDEFPHPSRAPGVYRTHGLRSKVASGRENLPLGLFAVGVFDSHVYAGARHGHVPR